MVEADKPVKTSECEVTSVADEVATVYTPDEVPYETFELELVSVVQETVALVCAVVEAIAEITGGAGAVAVKLNDAGLFKMPLFVKVMVLVPGVGR